jgi:hypothetical protein
LAGLLTRTQRQEVLSAAERWIAELGEWKSRRRPELPDSEAWL